MTDTTPARLNRPVILLLLALILALGFFARLYDINRESFWADEGWTMILAKGPTLADVVRTMVEDQHPPLYFVQIHAWMDLFGNSETMTRLLSTFWSLVGIALAYRLAADAFGPGAGLIAALLLALWDNDIMLARDVRHYSEMSTLAIASALFYLRYLRKPSRTNGIGWWGASVALMYTHYLGALLLAVQAIHALLAVRPLRRTLDAFIRLALVGLAWLPWAAVFIVQSQVRYTRPILYQSTLPNTPETFAIVRGDLFGSNFALTIGLVILGLIAIRYRDGLPVLRLRPMRAAVFLGMWVALPAALIITLNPRFPILTTRNFLLITPAILILIARGFMNLDRTARTFLLSVLVILCLFTVDAYLLKPPWRTVASDILQYRDNAAEPILMDVWTDSFALRYHIGRALNADPDTLPLVILPEWRETYKESFYAYLLEYLRKQPTFWLAYWGPEQNVLLDWFGQQGFQRTATQVELHRGEQIFAYRYDRIPTNPPLAEFGSLFALRMAQTDRTAYHAGDVVRVNMLWQALQAPAPRDYSISVFVLNTAGQLIGQNDGSPFDGRSPTSSWKPGDVRFDSKRITLPPNLPAGTYNLGVKVYWYAEPKPLQVNGADYFQIGTLSVLAAQ